MRQPPAHEPMEVGDEMYIFEQSCYDQPDNLLNNLLTKERFMPFKKGSIQRIKETSILK